MIILIGLIANKAIMNFQIDNESNNQSILLYCVGKIINNINKYKKTSSKR